MHQNRLSPFLNWFAGLFLLLGITGPFPLIMLLIGLFMMAVSNHNRLTVDENFVTGHDGVIKRWRVIIEKKNVRITEGRRIFGACWILDDRTSTQEILLYRWMFSSDQIKKLKNWL